MSSWNPGARLWFGGSLLVLHGWAKVTNFEEMSKDFGNAFERWIDISPTVNLAMAASAEALGAAFIVLGLFSRLSALACAFTMAVACFVVHQGALSGKTSGEMAFLYMGAFLVIFLAGPGRFSLDAAIGRGGNPR